MFSKENGEEPLITSATKEKVEACLEDIAKVLMKNNDLIEPLGLYHGKIGASMYLFNYFTLTGNQIHENLAFEIIENIAGRTREMFNNHSFIYGLSGIGWYIEYLAQNKFVENNTKEILSGIDNIFRNPIYNLLDFSLTKGMISYGMYYLSRVMNSENTSDTHKEILVQIINYLVYFLPEDLSEANEPENLTILQGYLAVIPFLCQIYKANINNDKVLQVLEKYVVFILQIEQQHHTALRFPDQVHHGSCILQWNSGDLAIANVLLQAATISKNKEWENKALEISLRTTSVKEIESSSISIFNGTAGITHLYIRLYQHYQLAEFKDAAIYWLEKTLNMIENQKHTTTEYGLINGLAGTGLVLMSIISEAEPTWDSALLIS